MARHTIWMRPGAPAVDPITRLTTCLVDNICGLAVKRPMPAPAGVLAALLMAACGGATGSVSSSPPGNLVADYGAIVTPSDAATASLWSAVTAQSTDSAKIRAAAKVCFDADVKMNSNLLAFEKKVPANVQRDIEIARAATSKEIADLQLMTASTTDDQLMSAFDAYAGDQTTFESAFALVRSDLGFPPPS